MKKLLGMLFLLLLTATSSPVDAGVGSSIVKALGRFATSEGAETAGKSLGKGVSEEVADRVASKLVKQGGSQSVEAAAKLAADHGPDVVRALDNVADPSAVLKALDSLPVKTDVPAAAARLAAGEAGKELGQLTSNFGGKMLAAELKHPGIAVAYAKSLGDEGIELCMKLNQSQALEIGRHLGDIANLPPDLRRKLLSLVDQEPERLSKYAKGFVANNPGKILFTTAATTLLLAQPESIFGTSGGPTGEGGSKGWIERVSESIFDRTIGRIVTAVLWVGIPIVCIFAAIKLYKIWRLDQRDISSVEPDR